MKIVVLISGRGSNLKAILDAEEKQQLGQAEVILVVSNNSKAKGIEIAKSYNKKTISLEANNFKTKEAYEKELGDIIKNNGADLIVLAGFMRILSPYFINKFTNKIINIHPSLLPSFPGLNAQKQALDFGVRISGCTVHFVNENVDAGPIILQKAVDIAENESEFSLSEKILKEEHRLLPLSIKMISEDKIKIEQNKVRIVK
ncbi:MAG: phosphoribosylglycinamide formyltransferase [Candidatus Heimdallarchaeota archaeon]|nr:phosphoribosylglycinamide formyltransferase [Candidatus Heimdallarchaeota archaeon]MCK4878167.1 phosphoribosylglycinamide formyltransferase [Candidatus Heimdallarchaeota archaeon]